MVQPFAQLGRSTHRVQAAERGATTLTRLKGHGVPTGQVLGLEKRGWRKGPVEDAGFVFWRVKPLGADLMAALELKDGLCLSVPSEVPQQKRGVLKVVPVRAGVDSDDARPLGQLDPITFSERVRDLEGLRLA